jgi:hypothetical protein
MTERPQSKTNEATATKGPVEAREAELEAQALDGVSGDTQATKEPGAGAQAQPELDEKALEQVSGGTTLSNLANMRHEMLKSIASNLRS